MNKVNKEHLGKNPDFSNKIRSEVSEEFTWAVSDVYKDKKAWDKDKKLAKKLILDIDIRKVNWIENASSVLELLDHITKIDLILTKTYTYSSLNSDTDMENSSFISDKGDIHSLFIDFSGKITFVEPDILKIGEEKIVEFMNFVPDLLVYKKYFHSIFRMEKHILEQGKSWIVAQAGLFSSSSEKASSMLDNVDIPAPNLTLKNGEEIEINTANYIKYRQSSDKSDRRAVMETYWTNHNKFKNTFAVLLDSAIKQHLFASRVHNYSDTLNAVLYPKKIDKNVYTNLIETVRTNLSPLHRYLKLKAKLLKIKKLEYGDIYASAVPSVNLSYTIKEAKELIIKAMAPLGNDYSEILKNGFNSRWMDIYPNKSKRSGAYSQGGVYDTHPFVLMNYNGTLGSVSTLAHEFGHALHSYYSNKNQPVQLADYPIFLAEIASTFNEILLTNYLFKNISDSNTKLYILDQYLDGIRGTLYRQTLFADFELKIHKVVENGGTLTPDLLDKMYFELTKFYYGHDKGIVNVNEYIKNEWSGIPHFYYNYYVYQYSTGISASIALADMVCSGNETHKNKYLDFLKSGDSDYPLEILKRAGVDLTSPKPILAAINNFEYYVSEMERILK